MTLAELRREARANGYVLTREGALRHWQALWSRERTRANRLDRAMREMAAILEFPPLRRRKWLRRLRMIARAAL